MYLPLELVDWVEVRTQIFMLEAHSCWTAVRSFREPLRCHQISMRLVHFHLDRATSKISSSRVAGAFAPRDHDEKIAHIA